MMATGFMEILMIVLLGGGGLNLPVGLPPLPPDAKMAQVAPEQVLAYLSWAGTAEADPKSGNATERMLADAQIQHFIKKIEDGILGVIKHEMLRGNKEAADALKHSHLLLRQVVLRPTTIYISKLQLGDVPKIEAGMVVNFGKESAAAKKALEAIEGMIAKELGPFQQMPANQGGLRRMPIPEEEAPVVAWGFEGDYFMLAIGMETAGRLRQSLNTGKAPAWLTDTQRKIGLNRNSSLIYVDAAALLKQFGPMAAMLTGGDMAAFDKVLAALGVDKITSIASVTGFDDSKFVSRSLLGLAPNAGGLFKLVADKGLTAKDLAEVPSDADLAFVAKLNPSEIFEEIVKAVAKIDPDASAAMMDEMARAEEELGFRIKQDLLDSVGDVWSIYNSPSEGGLVITGLTGVVSVKNKAKARKVVAAMEKIFNAEWNRGGDDPNPRRRRYEIKSIEHAGQTIRYINPVGDDWVVAPAWCVTDDRFVIAPYPQMVKAYLSRKAEMGGKSLADVAVVRPLLGGTNAPAMMTYIDTPELVKKFYPLVHGIGTMVLAQLQREGFEMDVADLPAMSAILPYLSPDTSTVTRTTDGILSESRSSLPMAGGVSMMLPAIVGSLYTARAASPLDLDIAPPLPLPIPCGAGLNAQGLKAPVKGAKQSRAEVVRVPRRAA
jgi:hypothetical protein